MQVTAQRLEASAFAPFGQVLERPPGRMRHEHAARLFNGRDGVKPNLAILCPEPTVPPLRVAKLERHAFSSQAFVPLEVSRYLIAVCPQRAGGTPDIERIQAFIAHGDQGINYDVGVWHPPMTVLDSLGAFAMLTWKDGSDADTECADVEADVVIVPP